MIKPVYEMLLWDNCSNHCSFCPIKDQPRLTIQQQELALTKCLSFIDQQMVAGSHLLLVGGELFDNPKLELIPFLTSIIERMKNGKIDLLYVNTNLLYKKIDQLLIFLDLIIKEGLTNRLIFTTSFDLQGRFKSEAHLELFKTNLAQVRAKVKVVANMILTSTVCSAIIDGLDIKELEDRMGCRLILIPYIGQDSTLMPGRELLFSALVKLNNKSHFIDEFLANLDLKQEKRLYKFDGQEFQFCSSDLMDCGHSQNFKNWSPKGSCFICDLKELFNYELYSI